MDIYTVDFDFDKLVNNLNEKKNFSFIRFGDGELHCAYGRKGMNCDGHEYFEDLGLELKKILESEPKYYIGLQPHGYNVYSEQIKQLKNIQFLNSDILHNASINKNLDKFFDVLDKRDIILVGPEYLNGLDKFKILDHVVIPIKNCWLDSKNIETKIKSLIKPDVVILYSASMMTNVILNNFYKEYGENITQIDCGSLFDPYVGKSTRTYHKKILNILNGNNNL